MLLNSCHFSSDILCALQFLHIAITAYIDISMCSS